MNTYKILNPPNLALVALTTVVVILLVVAIRGLYPSVDVPKPVSGENYPFTLPSEFPLTNNEDADNLESVVLQFLTAPAWQAKGYGELKVLLDPIEPLTRNGNRVGVTGIWNFGQSMDMPEGATMLLCGERVVIAPGTLSGVAINGLRIDLLDGQSQPYSIVPILPIETELEENVLLKAPAQVSPACMSILQSVQKGQ